MECEFIQALKLLLHVCEGCVEVKFCFFDKESKVLKPVDIKTKEKSTTTPKGHFTDKQPITELHIDSESKLKIENTDIIV